VSAPEPVSGEQSVVDEDLDILDEESDSDSAESGESGESDDSGGGGSRPRSPRKPSKARLDLLEQEGEIAADYLEGLLDIADLDGDIDMDVEGDRAAVSVVGADLKQLVGRGGNVLDAVQELTRLAVLRATGERSRLILDIGGFRAARREELTELGHKSADEVRASGQPVKLAPMTPFERKVVHDAIAAAGLRSESEGEEPNRRVVVHPS
jgi:spoIIIJ-associated protein